MRKSGQRKRKKRSNDLLLPLVLEVKRFLSAGAEVCRRMVNIFPPVQCVCHFCDESIVSRKKLLLFFNYSIKLNEIKKEFYSVMRMVSIKSFAVETQYTRSCAVLLLLLPDGECPDVLLLQVSGHEASVGDVGVHPSREDAHRVLPQPGHLQQQQMND